MNDPERLERLSTQIKERDAILRLLQNDDYALVLQPELERRAKSALAKLLDPVTKGLDVEKARDIYLAANDTASHLRAQEQRLLKVIQSAQSAQKQTETPPS